MFAASANRAVESHFRSRPPVYKHGRHSGRMSTVQTGGALAAAIEALLPGMCPHCDHPLQGSDRGLCGPCWSLTVPRAGGACRRCGVPTEDSSERCLACLQASPPQTATVVWGEHDGVLRTAILALKHGGRDDLAAPLGDRLAASIAAESWASAIDCVVPLPSHPWRRLKKPWAASELLADSVSRRLEKPVFRLLRRHGLGRQTGHSSAHRLELPRRSFSARPGAAGRNLLLIDDVTTTGTTLRRAAEALRRAGARDVYCGVCARAPDPRRYL
jgi:predicted amidophosphoribosyltransferase